MIDHCDSNDQETRENFWMLHLDTVYLKSLSQKRALKY